MVWIHLSTSTTHALPQSSRASCIYLEKKEYNVPKVGLAYVAAFERRWLKGSEPVVYQRLEAIPNILYIELTTTVECAGVF